MPRFAIAPAGGSVPGRITDMRMKSRRVCLAALAGLAPTAALAQQAAAPPPAPTTTAAPSAAPSGDAALNVLLRQAAYWRDQNNPPRAEEAARRALLLSPNNVQALGILVQVQANAGDEAAAP